MSHYAIINSSGRVVEVERHGRVLIVLHPRRGGVWDARGFRSVSTCRYDKRFTLLPREHKELHS